MNILAMTFFSFLIGWLQANHGTISMPPVQNALVCFATWNMKKETSLVSKTWCGDLVKGGTTDVYTHATTALLKAQYIQHSMGQEGTVGSHLFLTKVHFHVVTLGERLVQSPI